MDFSSQNVPSNRKYNQDILKYNKTNPEYKKIERELKELFNRWKEGPLNNWDYEKWINFLTCELYEILSSFLLDQSPFLVRFIKRFKYKNPIKGSIKNTDGKNNFNIKILYEKEPIDIFLTLVNGNRLFSTNNSIKKNKIFFNKLLLPDEQKNELLRIFSKFVWSFTNDENNKVIDYNQNKSRKLTPAVFSYLYEKFLNDNLLISKKELVKSLRKNKGAYYTPNWLAEIIIKQYIWSLFYSHEIKEYEEIIEFNRRRYTKLELKLSIFDISNYLKKDSDVNYERLLSKINILFDELLKKTFLDNACGTGGFLEVLLNVISEIYLHSIKSIVEYKQQQQDQGIKEINRNTYEFEKERKNIKRIEKEGKMKEKISDKKENTLDQRKIPLEDIIINKIIINFVKPFSQILRIEGIEGKITTLINKVKWNRQAGFWKFLINHYIIFKQIHGVDIDSYAIEIAYKRFSFILFNNLEDFLEISKEYNLIFDETELLFFGDLSLRFIEGNSLIGDINFESFIIKGFDNYDNHKITEKKYVDRYKILKKLKILNEELRKTSTLKESLSYKESYLNYIQEINRLKNFDKKKFNDIDIEPFDWWIHFPTIFIKNDNSKNKKTPRVQKESEKDKSNFKNKLEQHLEQENIGFSMILGNPPYGNLLSKDEKKIISGYASFPTEISSVFIERSINLIGNSGVLAYVLTYAITFHKKLSKIRQNLHNKFSYITLTTFDRDNCKLFEGMTQSISILLGFKKIEDNKKKRKEKKMEEENEKEKERKYEIVQSNGNTRLSGFFTTPMFRIYPEKGYSEIEYISANGLFLSNGNYWDIEAIHRLPKLPNDLGYKILQKLKNNKKTMGSFILSIKNYKKAISDWKLKPNINYPQFFWYRSSGNFWYNAWKIAPYESSEIKSIKLREQSIWARSLIILIINSSLFYFWFRIFGDGRHTSKDIMDLFPFPDLLLDNRTGLEKINNNKIIANDTEKKYKKYIEEREKKNKKEKKEKEEKKRLIKKNHKTSLDSYYTISLNKNFKRIIDVFELYLDILEQKMMENFDDKNKKFLSANIKPYYDIIDELIGGLYKLDEKEIKYLQNYDSNIRTGCKISQKKKKEFNNFRKMMIKNLVNEENSFEKKFLIDNLKKIIEKG